MTHQPYPPFQLECLTTIVRIVRSKAIAEERALFAKCLYEILGAGLALGFGEPDGPILTGQESAELEAASTAELMKCCEALESAQSEVQSVGDAEAKAIDPATLAILIDLAIRIITAIINRRKPA